jgi:hypothetical protein
VALFCSLPEILLLYRLENEGLQDTVKAIAAVLLVAFLAFSLFFVVLRLVPLTCNRCAFVGMTINVFLAIAYLPILRLVVGLWSLVEDHLWPYGGSLIDQLTIGYSPIDRRFLAVIVAVAIPALATGWWAGKASCRKR